MLKYNNLIREINRTNMKMEDVDKNIEIKLAKALKMKKQILSYFLSKQSFAPPYISTRSL